MSEHTRANARILECLSCERAYALEDALEAGVPAEYAPQYCSSACYVDFEAYLKAAAAHSEAVGLVEAATIASNVTSLTRSPLLNLLEQYKLKVTESEKKKKED